LEKILIVDDDESIRLLYSEELRDEGYEVYEASNGKEALDMLERLSLDLIILDIRMPEMGGIEALRLIKAKNPRIPVLLSSAYAEYKGDFASWCSDEYLIKSSDLSELKQAVKKHLKH
jgi:two-component system response regulator (stage 0 sporulation protein F)